jgi:hypothetical protein
MGKKGKPAKSAGAASSVNSMPAEQRRMLFGVQYWTACHLICEGMKAVKASNHFYVAVTLRSFIEYHRRGIWFLMFATDQEVLDSAELTFERGGNRSLLAMDKMIHSALGFVVAKSPLESPVIGLGKPEPFIDALHAITHGNPIAVRMATFGVDKVIQIEPTVERVDSERDWFTIVLSRRILKHPNATIWSDLAPIHNQPAALKAAAAKYSTEARPYFDKIKGL